MKQGDVPCNEVLQNISISSVLVTIVIHVTSIEINYGTVYDTGYTTTILHILLTVYPEHSTLRRCCRGLEQRRYYY